MTLPTSREIQLRGFDEMSVQTQPQTRKGCDDKMSSPASLPERMTAKIKVVDGCWEWQGYVTRDGYGCVIYEGRITRAHRAIYMLTMGAIPDGLLIDHLCRNRRCVNPAHLEAVTKRENTLRGNGVSAQCARQTACIHGHPFTAENTRIERGGKRRCRACDRERHFAARKAVAA